MTSAAPPSSSDSSAVHLIQPYTRLILDTYTRARTQSPSCRTNEVWIFSSRPPGFVFVLSVFSLITLFSPLLWLLGRMKLFCFSVRLKASSFPNRSACSLFPFYLLSGLQIHYLGRKLVKNSLFSQLLIR